MEIKGIVKAVSQKEKGYGVCINDAWFNGFGTCPVKKGDNVLIQFEVKGDFKNIKKIYPLAVDYDRDIDSEVKQKEEMNAVIDEAVDNPDWPKRKPVNTYPKDPVGLAVEIFNAIWTMEKPWADTTQQTMVEAIRLVKQAQKAF